jgi:hypothetical protein
VEGAEGAQEGVVLCGGRVLKIQRSCVALRGAERHRVIRG